MLEDAGFFTKCIKMEGRDATDEEILRCHTEAHLERIKNIKVTNEEKFIYVNQTEERKKIDSFLSSDSTFIYFITVYNILLCFILFYFILFYFILFYFILFYCILFYFILFFILFLFYCITIKGISVLGRTRQPCGEQVPVATP
jgi:hypothetical protein